MRMEIAQSRASRRVIALSVLFMTLIATVAWWVLNEAQERVIVYKARALAEVVARQAASARSVYAEQVVAKLARDGLRARRDYEAHPGAVPLPAQFLKELGHHASDGSDGLYRYKPLSKWNLEASQGLSDDFQRWAWGELEKQDQADPSGPIDWQPAWQIENLGGEPVLRYLRADPASSASCVSCHNAEETAAPVRQRRVLDNIALNKQWKLHQLLGAVEVIIPIAKAEALAQGQTRLAMAVIITVMLGGVCVIGAVLYVDLSRSRALGRSLAWQANHDSLTGLFNRARFEEDLAETLRPRNGQIGSTAVMIMDLDLFKEINDTLGHQVGDQILQEIAERLRKSLRPQDMVARMGGDEFALLLPRVDAATAAVIAARLSEVFGADIAVDGHRLRVRGSIGIALAPAHGDDASTLVRCADVAMYTAKRAKSQWSLYDRSEDEHSLARLNIASELRAAIDADQLHLCFQPKVELLSGTVVGVEALLRWEHPQHGSVPPDEVVQIAEHHGLIGLLTAWVLRCALHQCAAWRADGLPLHVAVNLSTWNLHDDSLVDQVSALLRDAGVPASALVLEVTETAMMRDPLRAGAIMEALDAMGVCLAVDDFGSGYSSLAYLNRLPVRELKLDKSFVIAMGESGKEAVIVRATADLARNLGLSMVAEGVEDEATLRLLRDMGCALAQGYHVCRPQRAEQLTPWLAGHVDPQRRAVVERGATPPGGWQPLPQPS